MPMEPNDPPIFAGKTLEELKRMSLEFDREMIADESEPLDEANQKKWERAKRRVLDPSTVYLNGSFVAKAQAALPVEDRGTLFGDGVYEVIRYYGGRPLGMAQHLARLRRSLGGIRLAEPADVSDLPALTEQVIERNGLRDAKVYWQITRGAGPRDYPIPRDAAPSVLILAYPLAPLDRQAAPSPLRAILTHDLRWSCCYVKALMLLPNMLAHNQALDAGADAAILHRAGRVTEATSANLFAVVDGVLRTHRADQWILGGVTRGITLDLARRLGLAVCEEAVSTDELLAADEVMLTGTTSHVAPVAAIDGRPIGAGEIGPVTRRLHEAFVEYVRDQCKLP